MQHILKMVKQFMKITKMHCSFFATWGSRTNGGQLYTMRNLDWNANTGINKNKIVFVWNLLPFNAFYDKKIKEKKKE